MLSNKMAYTIYIRKMRLLDAKQKLEREIHSAFLKGETYVEVIHGIGEQKLRKMTLEFIEENAFLRLIESEFVYNPGVTKIEILSPPKKDIQKIWKQNG